MSFEALALRAVRDTFGEVVTIDPDGVAVTVKAIARRPDREEGVYGIRPRQPTVTLEIITADLSAFGLELVEGDVIEMADHERRQVKGVPEYLDSQRLVLLVDTVAE